MKYSPNLIIAAILFVFCQITSAQTDKDKEALKQVDIEFSNLSVEKGMNKAFLTYASDDAVLLRKESYPVEGIAKIKEFLSSSDTSFVLTWTPMFADISKSTDLGYTYGTYELIIKSYEASPQVRRGTYVTIWKKDKNGNWKFVLDTGNSGLGEK